MNNLAEGPAVFAVEEQYQIIWTTEQCAGARVRVGTAVFSDHAAGVLRSERVVHKVCVPMQALDAAGGYELIWQSVPQRGGCALEKSDVYTRQFAFYPAGQNDEFRIAHLSDVHGYLREAAAAAAALGRYDLLVLNGDIAGRAGTQDELLCCLRLAHAVTEGTRPVLYAHGNHECRGPLATSLAPYVGAPGEDRYYYTLRLGSLWIAVLDVGEDKDDGHREYEGLADFADYRAAECRFFEAVIANAASEFRAPGVAHRLLVSHIPLGRNDGQFAAAHARFVALANQMELDLALFGHEHALAYYPAGAFECPAPAHNFASLIGGALHGSSVVGTAITLQNGAIKIEKAGGEAV